MTLEVSVVLVTPNTDERVESPTFAGTLAHQKEQRRPSQHDEAVKEIAMEVIELEDEPAVRRGPRRWPMSR